MRDQSAEATGQSKGRPATGSDCPPQASRTFNLTPGLTQGAATAPTAIPAHLQTFEYGSASPAPTVHGLHMRSDSSSGGAESNSLSTQNRITKVSKQVSIFQRLRDRKLEHKQQRAVLKKELSEKALSHERHNRNQLNHLDRAVSKVPSYKPKSTEAAPYSLSSSIYEAPRYLTPQMADSMREYVRRMPPIMEFEGGRRLCKLLLSSNEERKWAGRRMLYNLWRKDAESRAYLKGDLDELANTIENLAVEGQIVRVDPNVESVGTLSKAGVQGNVNN